jgi:putative membrane-bound dehydrogenase-like protein
MAIPAAFFAGFIGRASADAPPAPSQPLQPKEEAATFRLPAGFRIEMVACEPNVVDPVAMAFDEDGRLYVAEMLGYPNAGVATGAISTGRIKRLEDRDGDGFYEHATVFADHLRFPTSVMPWKGGLLVAVAPDLVFLEDIDGDGRADRKRILYTGFALENIQQLLNSLQWGLDNWLYGVAGGNGGTIRSAEKPDQPPVTLRGRGIRFHPERPGSLEPTSGGGQFGLAADDWQQWFTATNSQHLRHIVLPDNYLRRNPSLPVAAVTLDIPDHDAACKVFRISPFEAWRVERTRRRAQGPDAPRFPSTELVPGGFITSACSPVVYTADRFPAAYRGSTFVCDPANNLIHRDVLVPHGATFIARRGEPASEFLASTDTWFRPVNLTIGPDGALYVADFYREVIETPLSLPDDIKRKLNLESRARGRIWRIVPTTGYSARKPALGKAPTAELVRYLADANSWWRITAQRLLVERQDKTAVSLLKELARTASSAVGRSHALWTLDGLNALDEPAVRAALTDSEAGVRVQALRLAEGRLATSATLRAAVTALADDPLPAVRFQLAFTLGEANTPDLLPALARVARQDIDDAWTQMAVLSSAGRTASSLLESLVRDQAFTSRVTPTHVQMVTRLASLVGAGGNGEDLGRTLRLLGDGKGEGSAWQAAVLQGLGQGMQNSGHPLNRLWEQPATNLNDSLQRARGFFERAAQAVADERRPIAERVAAVRLLGFGPFATARGLADLLSPQYPGELQMAAVRALALQEDTKAAELLLIRWNGYGPSLRREVLEALFARPDRLSRLLDAVEHKDVLAGQIEPFRQDQLRKHPDPKLRQRARTLFAGQATADRRQVLDSYRPALDLKADPSRGKTVFKKNCSSCHRLENQGVEVGPDLLSALRTKTREGLLSDILDPSREVDPRYINYLVTTKAGRVFTGMIATDTGSSITLRRAEKAEDSILRTQIEEVQATAKSLMPEGLEMQLSKQDVADVIAYLQVVAGIK